MARAYEARARLCLPVGAQRQTPYGARQRYASKWMGVATDDSIIEFLHACIQKDDLIGGIRAAIRILHGFGRQS